MTLGWSNLARAITVVILLAPLAADGAVRDHEIVPEDYFGIGTVYDCVVSPGGQYAAYVESRWGEGKEGRQNDLWVVDLGSRELRRLTFDGFGAGHPIWSPDGAWIYFLGRGQRAAEKNPPHDGSRQVWRVSPDRGDPFPITRAKKGVGHFDLAGDGRTLYYTVGKEIQEEQWQDLREKYSDLEYGHGVADLDQVWSLDLVSWRAEMLLDATRVIHAMSLSPDGQQLALITTADEELIFMEGWSRVEVYDLTAAETSVVTPDGWRSAHPSPFGWLENLAWSGDSQALAFSIDFDGYAALIYVATTDGDQWSLDTIDRPGTVTLAGDLHWQGKSRTLCYRGEDQARIRVYGVPDVKSGQQGQTRTLVDGDVAVQNYSFDAKGKKLVAVVETTTHLNDICLVSKPDQYERVTNLNPQVDSWKLPQIQDINWTGADGDALHGILELPPDYEPADGPLPLIVELHGGPSSSTKYRLRLWIYGRALLPAKGYALFSPNYHGSTGYGDEFMAKLIGRENEIEVTDILTGMDAVIERGIADPERVGVMGWSNGGYLTNCLITAAPERFQAASSGAGVLDMVLQWGIEDTPGHVVNYMVGLPWEVPDHYRAASPVFNLDVVRTPTLIHVGGSDPRVPPAHSKALYRALRHYLDVPTELVIYPGEGHGLSTHENRLAKMEWDLAWFDHYLLGQEESEEE